jgi:SAM-dependent methyltransferase
MSVLEFGAAENSYMPSELKLSRHVGVGANQGLMDKNPSLTESFIANLNDVVEEQGIKSEELSNLGADTFDAVVMANTVDFLSNPREVLRSAWYLLKPGGVMMIPYVDKDAYKSKFERAQTKMWRDFNDDQHMWVIGSFFQFSAGDGWEKLKGFDISPEGAKKDEGVEAVLKLGGNNMFVVQARKAIPDEVIDPEDPEKSFKSKMWLMPVLEDRDKKLLAPRLTRSYQVLKSDEEQINALAKNVEYLPKVYESLIKMDQFAFTFGMQAQLAADLVTDSDFNGNEEQIAALKMGKYQKIRISSFD